jgi:predicted unusual protein kinase regulating ubiquinone biosynthesis (AarF/ABC1/UbiB family)
MLRRTFIRCCANELRRRFFSLITRMWTVSRFLSVASRLAKHAISFIPVIFAFLPMHWAGYGELWWRWALSSIQDSGPAFVKFSQWAATRIDVFPETMCNRLSQLHSDARPHPHSHSVASVEAAFGPGSITLDDGKPLGSGCIAQVKAADPTTFRTHF